MRLAMRLNREKQAAYESFTPNIYKLYGVEDRTLMFESKFECGNLYLAQKVCDTEYNLLMQNDINTNGFT